MVAVVEAILLAVFVYFLLRYYSEPFEHPIYKVSIYISWYLGFIGLILFPIDIGAAANEMGEADSTVLNVFWELIYWITFMLSWVYLPILMEYWASGRFSKKEKIKEALWINVKSYIIIVLVAIVFVVWFTIVTKFDLTQLQGWIVGVSNTYGLIFIVVFLGYGLGELPVTLWKKRDEKYEENEIYKEATAIQTEFYPIEEKIKLCNENILHIEKQLQVNKIKSIPITTALNSIHNTIPSMDQFTESRGRISTTNDHKDWILLTDKILYNKDETERDEKIFSILSQLNSKMKKYVFEYTRKHEQWTELVLRLMSLRGEPIPDDSNLFFEMKRVAPFYDKSRKTILTVSSIFCFIFSGLIFLTEATTIIYQLISQSVCLSPFGYLLFLPVSLVFKSILLLIPLIYISICMYRSFFRLKIPFVGTYTLFRHHSDVYALCFNAYYICRLQFSLCYHYFTLLQVPHDIYTHSELYNIMGQMETIPVLGSQTFNNLVPIFIILFCLFSFRKLFDFNLCKKQKEGSLLPQNEEEKFDSVELNYTKNELEREIEKIKKQNKISTIKPGQSI